VGGCPSQVVGVREKWWVMESSRAQWWSLELLDTRIFTTKYGSEPMLQGSGSGIGIISGHAASIHSRIPYNEFYLHMTQK